MKWAFYQKILHVITFIKQHRDSRLLSLPIGSKRVNIRSTFEIIKYANQFSFFKYGPTRASFCLFLSFQTNIKIFKTNKCEKCPSRKQRWDLNPWPLKHESPPITTRPELPPTNLDYFTFMQYPLNNGKLKGSVVQFQIVFFTHLIAIGSKTLLNQNKLGSTMPRGSGNKVNIDKLVYKQNFQGRGGSQVVNVLAFLSVDPKSNAT